MVYEANGQRLKRFTALLRRSRKSVATFDLFWQNNTTWIGSFQRDHLRIISSTLL